METTLRDVTVEDLGSGITVAASAGAGTITVEDPIDFAETSGALRVGDIDYDLDSCDQETGVIDLAGTLAVAVAVGDPVAVLTQDGKVAQEWTVEVEFADGEEPITATIPTGLIPFFIVGDEQAGATVSLTDDKRGGYVVASRPAEPGAFDGSAVWNPYISRRMTPVANIADDTWFTPNTWADEVSQGLTVTNFDVTIDTPGFYAAYLQVAYAVNAVGYRWVRILVNGVQVGYGAAVAETGASTYPTCTAMVLLAQGDVVTWQTKQTSGAGLPLVSGPGRNPFSLYRISV